MKYLLGYDIGSSSIKATLLDAESGKAVCSATSPDTELEMKAEKSGWAEQHPKVWWENVRATTKKIMVDSGVSAGDIKAIGISYQMHGLVLVDEKLKVLRPAIIWCDSRAVDIGNNAFEQIGPEKCLSTLLNSPGNFTASKLKWVKDNEPDIYKNIYKFMLPGDYIAMKMSGEICTTPSGLSEGIMWNFQEQHRSHLIFEHFGFDEKMVPEIRQTFSVQGELTRQAAEELGLVEGIKISYRAGDQPNNALSLNVLEPGEVAATAGTSGVVYGVTDKSDYDVKSRVNIFAHVNNKPGQVRNGILLCVNGTGILNSWLKANLGNGIDYPEMNQLAESVPVGSDGLVILPYGNGAERTLENKNVGASVRNLHFNVHDRKHLLRASQEGIVFALNYGFEIMKDLGVEAEIIRAGHANMFLSPLFREAFSTVTNAEVELYDTDGSQGAARGAGIGAGIYFSEKEAFEGLEPADRVEPNEALKEPYEEAYSNWKNELEKVVG